MGTDIGAIPSIHIALMEKHECIRGVILISPVNCKERFSNMDIDIFERLPEVKCPVLLIHGKQDEVTPFNKTADIIGQIRHAFEWFPSKGTHNNLCTKYRSKFFKKLKFFLEHLNYQFQKGETPGETGGGVQFNNYKINNYYIGENRLPKKGKICLIFSFCF
jgi:hypothetical protein